jgi:Uma2 family endonuclease
MSTTTILERGVTIDQVADYPMDDGNRYELIGGTVYKSTTPHLLHQRVVGDVLYSLGHWDKQEHVGVLIPAPGVLLSDRDVVAPDIVWISRERWPALLDTNEERGWIIGAPDLVVEVLSQGSANERRDRETKLALYDRYGTPEYWIVDRFERQVDIYRRDTGSLSLVVQVQADEMLTSPLLPGFACPVETLFAA